MFRVYKPRGLARVKAVQITADKAAEYANAMSGRVLKDQPGDLDTPYVVGIEIPTLDGNKEVPLNSWLIRHDDGKYEVMDNLKFEESYEVAVNRTS